MVPLYVHQLHQSSRFRGRLPEFSTRRPPSPIQPVQPSAAGPPRSPNIGQIEPQQAPNRVHQPSTAQGGDPRGRPRSAAAPAHHKSPSSKALQGRSTSAGLRRSDSHVGPPSPPAPQPARLDPPEPLDRRPQRVAGSRGPIKPLISPRNQPPATTPRQRHTSQCLTPPLAHQPEQESPRPGAAHQLIPPRPGLPPTPSNLYNGARPQSPPPRPAAPAPPQCRPAQKVKISPPCQDKCRKEAPGRAEPHKVPAILLAG
ncbi:hypothetical protein NDU88_004861 [Pleurodeles waltl]|uniref:Uncharacterized protein n=1 Tax=Pleurodeles waltl TaxID=8319 RepID=A0AAV7NKS1_PLEWA|nr:hypothetical protein NDU88_004861 [Pleurodeles waltl]